MRITPDKIIALACKYWNGSKVVDSNNKDILTGKFVRKVKLAEFKPAKRVIHCHHWSEGDFTVEI